jgi:SAM-dependent methyltransferase
MLIPIDKIQHLLISPLSKKNLIVDGSHYVTEDNSESYDVFELPILIDFESSIMGKDQFDISYDSPVNRTLERTFLKKIYSFMTDVKPKKTIENLKEVFSQVKDITHSPLALIIGGGTVGKGLEFIYDSQSIDVIAFDIYATKNIQFIADAHNIPIADNKIDIVIVQAVLEHVLEPSKVVSEIYRVLKSKGIVYAETPFMQHVHEGAYDFSRYTVSGHRYLFKNFEEIKSGFTNGAATQLLWSVEYFIRGVTRSIIIGKIFKMLFFWLKFFDIIIPEKYAIDAASGTFFAGRKSEFSMPLKKIITFYRGAQ